jgi:hypothetical protein
MQCKKGTVFLIGLVLLAIMVPFGAMADDFKLIPTVGVRGDYDDNLFFNTTNEVDDYITRIFGGLELLNRTERSSLNLSAKLNGLIYADNDDLNDVEQFYKAGIGYRITEQMGIKAGGGYSEDSRPGRDIETSGIVLTGVIRKRWQGHLSSDVTLTEKSAVDVSYAYRQDKFDKAEFVDYKFHTANLGFTHDFSKILPRVMGRINAGYNYYNSDDTDIENVYATVGFSRDITEIFYLLIDAGYRYSASEFKVPVFVPYPPFLATSTETQYDSGFNGEIVLRYTGETTRADISASQRLEPASGRNGAADRTSFLFNVRKRFAEKFSANLYATYYLNKADAGKLAVNAIDEETVSIRPGLSYEIIDHLVLTASYTYTQVKYKISDTEAKRNRFYVQLSYGIPLFE